MLKALFVFSDIYFLVLTFCLCKKRLDKKAMLNFKIYDVTDWTANNCNIHITQYLKKERQSGNEIWSVNKM